MRLLSCACSFLARRLVSRSSQVNHSFIFVLLLLLSLDALATWISCYSRLAFLEEFWYLWLRNRFGIPTSPWSILWWEPSSPWECLFRTCLLIQHIQIFIHQFLNFSSLGFIGFLSFFMSDFSCLILVSLIETFTFWELESAWFLPSEFQNTGCWLDTLSVWVSISHWQILLLYKNATFTSLLLVYVILGLGVGSTKETMKV